MAALWLASPLCSSPSQGDFYGEEIKAGVVCGAVSGVVSGAVPDVY